MISAYSFTTSVVVFNIALVLVYLLRRRRLFLARYGTQTLLMLTVLGMVRLFSPIDLELAYIVRSYTIIPAMQNALDFRPIDSVSVLTVRGMLICIWVLGTCVFAVKDCILLHLDFRRRAHYRPQKDEIIETVMQQLGIKYPVVVSRQVSSPHVAGFIKPRIYVPPLKLSQDEWTYVLKHELQHIKSHDTAIKLFYFMIQAIFWWNPVSHLFMRELDSLLEMRCDLNITAHLDETERMDYLGALLSVMNQVNQTSSKPVPVKAYFAESGSDLIQRFRLVLDYDANKAKAARKMVSAVMVVLFLLSYFVILQPAYFPDMDEMENVHTVTEETSFILYDGEKYYLYIDNEFFSEVSEEELTDAPYNTLDIYEGSG